MKIFFEKNKIFLVIVVGALIASGFILVFIFWIGVKEKSQRGGGTIVCTLEAKLCPDGSYIQRVPPNCEFAPCPQEQKRKVLLYYYNSEKDKDETGNIKCSRDGLVVVERETPISQTPIQDTIKLLIEGKLKDEERIKGITTEYPLEGFKLLEVSLKEEILTLKFDDLLNRTSGGSCRVGILWFQIEATAKQFLGVKKVQFLPEELFQP